ncbi:TRAP transporter large permease [Phaeovulum sp.]|uniref:TRAP transporter large permease n=1 Tax=Phaeovulum sp. TaxID=2934796 RepID=UPI00356A4D13
MTASVLGLLVIGLLFLMLFLRMPVWLTLALCGIGGNLVMSNFVVAKMLAGTTPFDVSNSYGLSVIPLFILMGEIATGTRLSAELFQAARVILSGLRGGLAIATIGASGLFGAVCGSSVATAATMTRIALPEMRKSGYEDGYAAAAIAAGGSLGILIPPSIILIIFGAIAEQSIRKLFAAALIPGILLMLLYIVVAVVVAARVPGKVPADQPAKFGARLRALRDPWQFAVLFTVTIGGIYAGIFSPNEAAAIGAFGAIVIGVAGRRVTLRKLLEAVRTTAITSAVLFMIMIGATMFSNFVVQTRLPHVLLDIAQSFNLPGWGVMALIVLIYIILGCFLEGIGMVLVTVPVFLPIVVGYGYDPIWFAIIVVIVVELGLIHPPVGMNLFVIQAQVPDLKMTRLYMGILPFLLAPFGLIALLFLFPSIAMWLPSLMR